MTQDECFNLLAEARIAYGILETDYCGQDRSGMPSEKSCDEHFEIE